VIEYTVVANTSIYQQEIGFTNKHKDLLVYRCLDKLRCLYVFVSINDIWD